MARRRQIKSLTRKGARLTLAKQAMSTASPADDAPKPQELAEFQKSQRADREETPSGFDAYARYLRDLLRNSPPLLTAAQEYGIGRLLEEHIIMAADNIRKDLLAAEACLHEIRAADSRRKKRLKAESFVQDPSKATAWRDAARLISLLNPDSLKGDALWAHLIGLLRGQHAEELFELNADPNGKELRDHFVAANLRLVITLAKKFGAGAMPVDELVQEGNLGLMHAILRFDHRQGFRFSTYASWWIRHAVSRGITDKGRLIRMPVHMIEFNSLVVKERSRLAVKLGRAPTDEEIAASFKNYARQKNRLKGYVGKHACAALLEKIRSLNQQIRYPLSLDYPQRTEDGDTETLHDTMAMEIEETSPLTPLRDGALSDIIRRAMTRLSPIEIDVLRLRLGFEEETEHTFKEIGDKYHLSRERIRQIQNHALSKLKSSAELRRLHLEFID